ncbi:MAG: hypothetical protein LBJ67_13545 [Planctomycetaceae bacterium]|nr:hypothetical protein [Planctomycetaceae bacterium]
MLIVHHVPKVPLAATTGLNAVENEKNVSATLPSVALFKNGVTVVQQEIDIPAVGVYC